jgi:nicotinate dehydrogenase subunit B
MSGFLSNTAMVRSNFWLEPARGGYPILRFSEVPDMQVELESEAGNLSSASANARLGPTAAAIGNAVAHALGVRIHDMPLTRERIMATC